MKEEATAILHKIYSSLQERDTLHISLLQGDAGYCLFEKLYIEYSGKGSASSFQENLQAFAENTIGNTFPTFANGKAGINWFFSYLNKTHILSKADWKTLCDDDPQLANDALNFLAQGHYDFLHGAIGIAYHLLYSRGNSGTYKNFYIKFFDHLEKIGDNHEGRFFIPDFDRGSNKPMPDKVNFGLAHGVPSIIKFCVQCYKQNICTNEAQKIALQMIDLLKTYANKDRADYCFPSYIMFGTKESVYSRLGWCYGDLGVGIILYQAAIAFNDDDLKNYALEVLIHTTKRRNVEQTYVYDADLCHGAAGIAHIYNKMWHYTQNITFKNASDFWMQKTIDMAIYEDGLGGYKSYLPYRQSYEKSYALLDGACGIGLALISYLTDDFSWDYCLMLND